MVFQNYALYPHMTVRDNMAFACRLAKRPKAEIDAARGAAPPRSSASTTLLDRYPRQLSGGQRQRVAMGRAIVRDPQVFLFDEPLSNLDAKLRVQMRTEIKELHQRLKTTSIYVTHDQIEAMTMADKIVVMRDGRRRADRRAARALRPSGEPVRRRLHRLAGDELPARHRARATARRRRRVRRRRAPARSPARARRDGQPVVFGMRPEHFARRRRRHAGRSRGGRADRRRHADLLPARRPGRHGGGPRAPRIRARRARSRSFRTRARAHLFDAASGNASRRSQIDRLESSTNQKETA